MALDYAPHLLDFPFLWNTISYVNEHDLSGKKNPGSKESSSSGQEQVGVPRSFMVSGDVMGICIVLAMKMTKTGLGDFRVRAMENNDIDPNTGELYPDGNVKMLMEGQEDFSAYNKALKEILEVRQNYLEAFDQFYAGMAVSEEIDRQVSYFRLGIGY